MKQMKPNDTYWLNRQQDLYKALSTQADKELAKQYLLAQQQTKQAILELYDEIEASIKDKTILASDFYKYNRYWVLLDTLNRQAEKIGVKEIQITETKLKDMYNKSGLIVGKSVGFNGDFANTKDLDKIINSVWCADGKTWSARVWANKSAMINSLEKGLFDCIARGVGKDEVVKQLRRDYDVAYHQADRLVRTELSYIQNQGIKDGYIDAGIHEYEILDSQDEKRECDDCKELSGKVFKLSEAVVGENFPPIHPNCVCTILAVLQ